ncbi:MAG TPA: hypothetical protein DCQ06_13450 [Myxococcales bacterium]|nr:hypothetical protein [Myxococcales bacterium]HAN32595.1 hypothetical protein [Myxococcales bacterium]
MRRWALVTITVLLWTSVSFAQTKGALWTAKRSQSTGLSNDSPVTMGAFSKLAKLISPAVVNINIKGVKRFRGERSKQVSMGSGTGFFIHPDGYLLTNNHVIARAQIIEIRTADDRTFQARVIGSDARTDIALLKVNSAKPFPIIPLGNSGKLQIGEWVVAVGNPYGLGHTVTAGIVSAKGRSRLHPGSTRYANYIQTDASINPGNSGGPLVNIHGEVIGINTAVHGKAQGIGFAIPSNMAKTLVPQLAKGQIERSWLGISVGEVTPEVARALRLNRAIGAYIRVIAPQSPAKRADLRPGDVVLRFDGQEVKKSSDLPWMAASAGVGRAVEVELIRAGKALKRRVVMARQPGATVSAKEAAARRDGRLAVAGLGMKVIALKRRIRRRFGIAARTGALILTVDAGGPADAVGLRPGDVVIQADRRRVDKPVDLIKVTNGFAGLEMVPLYVVRGRGVHFVMLRKSRLP